MEKVKSFIKGETVLLVAVIATAASMFIVKPSPAYIGYINFETLIVLAALMFAVQLLSELGVLDWLTATALKLAKTDRAIVLCMIILTFFLSMFMTNDVCLVAFVPFTILVLKNAGSERLSIPTVSLQTVAANLGSMLTPIGNPHNIYLYQISGMSLSDFMGAVLPYAAVAFVLLIVGGLIITRNCKTLVPESSEPVAEIEEINDDDKVKKAVFPKLVLNSIFGVDWFLLLTFVAFFILTGNLQHAPAVRGFFENIIGGHEFLSIVAASQCVSNVPASIMLSGFTENYRELLIGANVGGLGTLIASMASLISYKAFASSYNNLKWRYLAVFTFTNVIFLVCLIVLHTIISL